MTKPKFGEGISIEQFKKEVKKGHVHKAGRNKFNAMPTAYNGVMYDSRAEAKYAAKLDMLKTASGADKIVNIERQVKYSFDYNGKHICSYVCDFKITYADGRTEVHDVKGFGTREFSIKRKLLKAYYDIDIKIIKVE